MPHTSRRDHPLAASTVARFVDAFDAFCTAERIPEDVAWRVRVVLDEIIANVVMHGTTGAAVPAIDVTFRREGDRLEVVVADDGPPFDPLARPEPDLTAPIDTRRPGGLGIVLIKSLMDTAAYERTTRNVLTVTKRIEPDDTQKTGNA